MRGHRIIAVANRKGGVGKQPPVKIWPIPSWKEGRALSPAPLRSLLKNNPSGLLQQLQHALRRRGLRIPRFAAGGKAHSFRCGSFPHRTRGRRRWASAGAPEVGERTAPYGRAAAPENRSRPQGPPLQ